MRSPGIQQVAEDVTDQSGADAIETPELVLNVGNDMQIPEGMLPDIGQNEASTEKIVIESYLQEGVCISFIIHVAIFL